MMHGPGPPKTLNFQTRNWAHDTSHAPMYEVRSAGVKGLGVFAKSLIPRGTRIFSERPLLAIKQDQNAEHIFAASQLLSATDRAILMGLSHYATKESSIIRWIQALKYTLKYSFLAILGRVGSSGEGGSGFPGIRLKNHMTALSIFRSNSFNLGSTSIFRQALFPSISRINHSCVPNAQGSFHDAMGKFNVHATRDIGVSEELTLNYLHERGAIRGSRQRRLFDGYGFTCDCPACDLEMDRGKNGEKGREELQKMLGEYAESVAQSGVESPEKEVKIVEQFIRLLEGDKIAGRELATLYFEAAKLNGMLGKSEEALLCAERGLEIDEDCLGRDHVQYEKSLIQVQAWR